MFNDEKYDWETILEMFGGYKYFTKDHLLFVYHDVNGRKEEAAKIKVIIDEENERVEAALKKLKKPEDIVKLNEDNETVIEIEDNYKEI